MKRRAEVVIIGGGIQGLSLAYHLACKGLTDVLLVEMDTLGSGSSGRSAAIIGHAFTSENCLPLVQLSYDALMHFPAELDADPGYEPIGALLLAGVQAAPDLLHRYALLQQLGIESQLVDGETVLGLTPGLYLADIEVALHTPLAGCIDPHFIMMAYAHHARRLGVEIVEGVRATGLEVKGGRVIGLHTTSGLVATPCVVNAAGFRARQVATWAGMDLPITNLKRHIFCTGPVPIYSCSIPFTYEMDLPWYMRREGPGVLIGMGSVESDETDPQVDWSFLDTVVDHSVHRAPPLAEAGIKTAWAGLRPITPDDDPVLGPANHLSGFFNDCGWGGHGVMLAPAGGLVLAEWIADGEATSVDVRRFGAERLAGTGKATQVGVET